MKTKKITIEGSEKDIQAIRNILSDQKDIKIIDPLSNRFFLEEINQRHLNSDEEYVQILIRDWLSELVKENPLTEESRLAYIKENYAEDFVPGDSSRFFDSEQQLQEYLNGEYHG